DTEAKYIDAKNPKTVVSGGKLSLDLAGKYGSKDGGYAFTKGSGRLYASLNKDGRRKLEWSGDKDKFKDGNSMVYAPVITAGKKNLWDTKNLPYFEAEFSTKGQQDISFSASIGATKKGPKSYRMAYRVGNSGSYTTLFYASATLTLTQNKQFVRMSAKLPDAAENQDKVMVKIYATEAATVGGGSLTDNPSSGKIGINHILVEGTKIKTQSKQQTSKNNTSGEKIRVGKAVVSKVTLKKKKVSVSIKKMSGVSGYQVQAASDKKIKKNVKTVSVKGKKAVIKKWKKKKCYVRVRAYKIDASGKRIYGKWSSVKKAK
ncbi:MAG: hypothetical protein K2K70_08760, partial [Lachnospiraceae bacterium]|nr:hypothetical protein [Lachnospiraceae bacterium]